MAKPETIELNDAQKEVVLRGIELFEKEVKKAVKSVDKLGKRARPAYDVIQALATVELDELKAKFL